MARTFLTLLFLITAVTLFFLQTKSYFGDINVLRAEKQKYEEVLANSRELQSLRDELLSRYNAIPQEDINKLNKILPFKADTGSLIVMIENRVKAHGLLLKRIDVGEGKQSTTADPSAILGVPPPLYKSMNLSFSISGPYASVLALFKDLEKSLRLIDINIIGFSSAPLDTYEFNITAKTYVASSIPDQISEGKEKEDIQQILDMLNRLRNIKIDSEFFNSDIFKSFIDFTPTLVPPTEYGRLNPFAPLEEEAKKP